jgi:hypothetical protein
VARNEERIEKLREEVMELEEALRGKNAARANADGVGGRKKKRKEEEEEDGAEEGEDKDEFYDRVGGGRAGGREGGKEGGLSSHWRLRRGLQKVQGRRKGQGGSRHGQDEKGEGSGEVDTFESLSEKLEGARRRLAALVDAPPSLPTSLPPSLPSEAEAGGGGREVGGREDSLDKFMVENAAKTQASAYAGWLRRKEGVEEEVRRLEALVEVARPALPALKRRGGEGRGGEESGREGGQEGRGGREGGGKEREEGPGLQAENEAEAERRQPREEEGREGKGSTSQPPPPPPPALGVTAASASPEASPPSPSSSTVVSSLPQPAPSSRPLPGPHALPPSSLVRPPPPSPPPSPPPPPDVGPSKRRKTTGPTAPPSAPPSLPPSLPSGGATRDGGEDEAEKMARSQAVEGAEDAYVAFFHRPKGQKGDGRTALNDKLGY